MSTFGKNIIVSLFGESHSSVMGITIHHLPSGIVIDLEKIKARLLQRKGLKELSTSRNELDQFEIVSGYFNGYTTGAPLTVLLYNCDVKSNDYDKIKTVCRPSHADYVAYEKYKGFNDYRGGGHFSGRITALLVILGSICEDVLKTSGIKVISRVQSVGKCKDLKPLVFDEGLTSEVFPVVDEIVKEKMIEEINEAKVNCDSVGGVIETSIFNVPCGIGEPFFDSLESVLSHLIFSIPGVKGIEFGGGFTMASMYGSEVNDQMTNHNGVVDFLSNYSGGINGGISNGNTINFKIAVKPTPSIAKEQQTINLKTKENEQLSINGRHDPIIAIKALHVINALSYYGILEMMMESRIWH